jgi:hypothetical protein
MTPREAEEYIRQISGPVRRTLEGDEYTIIFGILKTKKPKSEFNNQRSITEVYRFKGKTYHVCYWSDEEPMIEEIQE